MISPRIDLPPGYKVGFQAWPGPQTDFLAAPDDVVLFGGAAGPGKSTCAIIGFLRFVKHPEANGIIFRKRFSELQGLIKESRKWYPMCGGRLNLSTLTWTFPSGAQIRFAGLERAGDELKYQGQQYHYICWDELTHWPTSDAFIYMFSRLRRDVKSSVPCQMRATTNPGGPGEAWVQEIFRIVNVKDMHEGTRFKVLTDVTLPDGQKVSRFDWWRFIPAKVTDNPSLDLLDYATKMSKLTPSLRKQLQNGIWGVSPTVLFPEFDHDINTCAPFLIPKSWKRWRGGDDGFADPTCILWFAQNPTNKVTYVWHELYEAKVHADVWAKRILAVDRDRTKLSFQEQQINEPMETLAGTYDSAAFDNDGKGTAATPARSRGDTMNDLGCKWEKCSKGPGSIKRTVQSLRELLRVPYLLGHDGNLALNSQGEPVLDHSKPVKLVIFRSCVNTVAQMTRLCHEPGDPDQPEDGQKDHAFDALRYGLQFTAPTTKKVQISWGGSK